MPGVSVPLIKKKSIITVHAVDIYAVSKSQPFYV